MAIDMLEPPSTAELNDPLAGSLCHELRKTTVAVTAAMSREFGKWKLKPSEATLLRYIGANPGCTQSEIARAHRNKASNLTPLITGLERAGLLKRTAGGGRTIGLSLSKNGNETLADVDQSFQRLEKHLDRDLTAEQLRAAIDLLHVVCIAACHYETD